jgi:predicted secreted protein with PEFG-CTERM motif
MITKNTSLLVAIFVILASITMVQPLAFAEDKLVSIPAGTSVPGCEETDECFIPASVTVNPRDTVTWANDDTAAHTVTSGTVESGPDEKFDSSLFMAGTTFEHTFDTLGVYPYFCMVHPWMVGSVLVTVGGGTEIPLGTIVIGDAPPDHTTVFGMTSDGKVRVEINTGVPITNEKFSIEVNFRDSTSGLKQHANYDITATQSGNTVLSVMGAHEHDGTGEHETAPLPSNKPVDIQVTINGFGLPDEESNWTGPIGEVISLQVVPEFGTIAVMILGIAIISIIAVTARSKVIPRL